MNNIIGRRSLFAIRGLLFAQAYAVLQANIE